MDLAALVAALASEDGKRMPDASHPAFAVEAASSRWRDLHQAWVRIGPMFWGPRIDLGAACATIRTFLASLPRN